MSEEDDQHDITKQRVVYQMPEEGAVVVRRDIEYRSGDGGALTLDVYALPDAGGERPKPAVVFVSGYPDPGFEAMLGCKLKEMESYVSWARLAAASGLVAITYSNESPAEDVFAVLHYIRENAESLGVDENRIGIWSCSGNVPNALSVLMQEERESMKCAVLCYGFMLDLGGTTAVAEAASQVGFVNPCVGRSVDDLPGTLPLFVARAGQDEFPGLNDAMDRFLAAALARNLPLTFTNHAEGQHAFDLFDDTDISRQIVAQILAFMRFHLVAE